MRTQRKSTLFRKVDKLEQILDDAEQACKTDAVYQFTMAYTLPISILNSDFVEVKAAQASAWMAEKPPKELHFSHGQYYEGEKGTAYVIKELKKRETSRRALLSLISMKDIFNSHDNPLPAFLLLQFGIDNNTLYVCAYFRALEVSEFLKINLVEICLHSRRIRDQFPKLKQIQLLIVAFRAYSEPEFFCLQKAAMDRLPPGSVAVAVTNKKISQLIEWLQEKRKVESIVVTDGMEELVNAIELNIVKYSPEILTTLRMALSILEEIRKHRETASEGDHLKRLVLEYDKKQLEAIKSLSELPSGGP